MACCDELRPAHSCEVSVVVCQLLVQELAQRGIALHLVVRPVIPCWGGEEGAPEVGARAVQSRRD